MLVLVRGNGQQFAERPMLHQMTNVPHVRAHNHPPLRSWAWRSFPKPLRYPTPTLARFGKLGTSQANLFEYISDCLEVS
jgi:hypothetical protein